jgi:hypothetical protein
MARRLCKKVATMPSIPSKKQLSIPYSYFMGIDPGVNGGIAMVYGNGNFNWAVPMPDTQADILEMISSYANMGLQIRACVEWIHPAIQGIGKSAMSKLYGNYRELQMALTCCKIPFETPMPRKCQQVLGISPRKKTETQSQWKNRLRAKAQQLFPGIDITLKVADAILIAEFCRRLHNVS